MFEHRWRRIAPARLLKVLRTEAQQIADAAANIQPRGLARGKTRSQTKVLNQIPFHLVIEVRIGGEAVTNGVFQVRVLISVLVEFSRHRIVQQRYQLFSLLAIIGDSLSGTQGRAHFVHFSAADTWVKTVRSLHVTVFGIPDHPAAFDQLADAVVEREGGLLLISAATA